MATISGKGKHIHSLVFLYANLFHVDFVMIKLFFKSVGFFSTVIDIGET